MVFWFCFGVGFACLFYIVNVNILTPSGVYVFVMVFDLL